MPNDFLSLPSLRPKNRVGKQAPLTILTGSPNNSADAGGAVWGAEKGQPTTPTEENSAPTVGTISPTSKPKTMGHLID
jgi:NAD-dependent histone deacetylase SIR2